MQGSVGGGAETKENTQGGREGRSEGRREGATNLERSPSLLCLELRGSDGLDNIKDAEVASEQGHRIHGLGQHVEACRNPLVLQPRHETLMIQRLRHGQHRPRDEGDVSDCLHGEAFILCRGIARGILDDLAHAAEDHEQAGGREDEARVLDQGHIRIRAVAMGSVHRQECGSAPSQGQALGAQQDTCGACR
jgi:hypothetical protein